MKLPKHTCPNIDALQKRMKYVSDDIKGLADVWRQDDPEQAEQLEKCAGDVYDVIYELEDLRTDNSALREYGEDLRKDMEKLEVRIDELDSTVSELSEYIKELERTNLELQSRTGPGL